MDKWSTVPFLLVEDDEIDIECIKRSFRKLKLSNPLFVANNGYEALELLESDDGKRLIGQPFVIITDLNMPKMGGLPLLEKIRSDNRLTRTPIFVLTTSNLDSDRQKAFEYHISAYLLKSKCGVGFIEAVAFIKDFIRLAELE